MLSWLVTLTIPPLPAVLPEPPTLTPILAKVFELVPTDKAPLKPPLPPPPPTLWA